MKLSCILVHYHAAALAVTALGSVREEAARCGLQVESLVVDNGSEPWERDLLTAAAATRIDAGGNVGFAAGVNLGASRARGDALLCLNPDVRLLEGCLSALLDRLERGAGVAGPRFYWDAERRMLLPPAERRDRGSELLAALALRGEPWSARARRRWRRHARRHWRARAPLVTTALSGACLAISASAWRATGPMDEEYRLYFEETEWLLRAAASGVLCEHVPAAAALHEVGRSAARESEAAAWFEASARRFRRRRFGGLFTRLLERLAQRSAATARRRAVADEETGLAAWQLGQLVLRPATANAPATSATSATAVTSAGAGAECWLELSPDPRGFPAATERLPETPEFWSPPPRVREALGTGRWWLRHCDAAGRETGAWRVERQ